jgi:hypothetical protein
MIHTKSWTIDVLLTEVDGQTRAQAVLHSGAVPELRGLGAARKNPVDTDIPEIGDELATSRALADLAHQLLEAAALDVESVTHEHVHLPA